MKITIISDTHNYHKKLQLSDSSDLLIHAGDFSSMGHHHEIEAFLKWLTKLRDKYKYIIFIAGNHDTSFQKEPDFKNEILKKYNINNSNIYYLENSGIELEGFNIWGSPWSPIFNNWTFGYNKGKDPWHLIPDNTNILITHGPPHQILDKTWDSRNSGCNTLRIKIESIKDLKLHCFGHIHESGGNLLKVNSITYVNASICNLDRKNLNKPQEIEI